MGRKKSVQNHPLDTRIGHRALLPYGTLISCENPNVNGAVEKFLEQKHGLMNRLTQKDKNLGERSRRYWTDLENENYMFDSQQRISAAVESLTKSDMQVFLKKLVERLNNQRLLIYSDGKFTSEENAG